MTEKWLQIGHSGPLGGVSGGFEAILGGSGAVLARSWSDFLNSPISDPSFYRFFCGFGPFWSPTGSQKGAILGAKMVPKSIPKRGRNLRPKKLPLGSDLGRFWLVLGGVREAFLLIFYWFLYYFLKIHVFHAKRRPRAIREPKRPKNGAKRPPKTTPRWIKNDVEI